MTANFRFPLVIQRRNDVLLRFLGDRLAVDVQGITVDVDMPKPIVTEILVIEPRPVSVPDSRYWLKVLAQFGLDVLLPVIGNLPVLILRVTVIRQEVKEVLE